MIEIKEITKEEFQQSLRNRNSWKKEEMIEFAKELPEKYGNKIIQIKIEQFYKMFYNGDNNIKYKNYYCKKYLQKCFEILQTNSIVTTSKDKLLIQLRK